MELEDRVDSGSGGVESAGGSSGDDGVDVFGVEHLAGLGVRVNHVTLRRMEGGKFLEEGFVLARLGDE